MVEIAIKRSIDQLEKIKKEDNSFIDAHILILSDPYLLTEIKDQIDNKKSVNDAINITFNKYIKELDSSDNEYMRQRIIDLEDVKERLLSNISKENISLENIGDVILIVPTLYPSLLYGIDKQVKGIIVSDIGLKSHAVLVCKEKKIPLVKAQIPAEFVGDILIDDDLVILNPIIKDKVTNISKNNNLNLFVPEGSSGYCFNDKHLVIYQKNNDYANQIILIPDVENVEQYNNIRRGIILDRRLKKAKINQCGLFLNKARALADLEDFKNVNYILVDFNNLVSELFNLSSQEVFLYEDAYKKISNELIKIINFGKINNISIILMGDILNHKEMMNKLFNLGLKDIVVHQEKEYEAVINYDEE